MTSINSTDLMKMLPLILTTVQQFELTKDLLI